MGLGFRTWDFMFRMRKHLCLGTCFVLQEPIMNPLLILSVISAFGDDAILRENKNG